uniref:Putative signal recognition particle receptor beta subunit n=1 Tax=Ixodes ricinus TaxID=34613 RepID=A0A0K8R4K1_IXORI
MRQCFADPYNAFADPIGSTEPYLRTVELECGRLVMVDTSSLVHCRTSSLGSTSCIQIMQEAAIKRYLSQMPSRRFFIAEKSTSRFLYSLSSDSVLSQHCPPVLVVCNKQA